MSRADVVFLAHFTGGGIDAVLDMDIEEFFAYMEAAAELYKTEMKAPRRAVVAGFEK
ncbi:MAG: hypothetical protein LBU42_04510 [Prevotellaceae bacterium]|jgi:hypothetical protein|nr:hypothetical protein [Prevotellaceae bacterium]